MEIKTFFITFNHIHDKICFRESLRTLQFAHTLCSQVFTAFWLCSHCAFPVAAPRLHCSVTAQQCCFAFVFSEASVLAGHRFFSSKHNDAFSLPFARVSGCPSCLTHPVLNCWLHAGSRPATAQFPPSPLPEQRRHLKGLGATLQVPHLQP